MFAEPLEQLFEAVNGAEAILILPHNNPDPDAIAGAIALRHLLKEGVGIEGIIAYRGLIGRAENQALVRYLGYPLQRLKQSLLDSSLALALVDTQPGAGNNPLPSEAEVSIVIDHHPLQPQTAAAKFSDVRPEVGSTATIMVEYLRLAELKPDPPLATALFYGIKTDTLGLGRETSSSDTSAICYLLPLIDLQALLNIERAKVPADYFKSFAATLQTARIYNGVIIAYVGVMSYPDLTAEMADFLLRMQGSVWVICLGIYKERLIISARTQNQRGAGQLVQQIIGNQGISGGHGAMAGGQLPLNGRDAEQLAQDFSRQVLQHLQIPPETVGEPLV